MNLPLITDSGFYAVAVPAVLLMGLAKSGFLGGFGSLAVPLMALVVIVFAALNLAATAGLRHAAIEVSRRSLRVAAQADSFFLENARAARAIRLFGKELVRASVWRNKFVELTNLGLADGRLTMFSGQAAQLTSGLGNVALIAVGTWLVLGNGI
ncbi:MAG TPA: hypothetical protein VGP22_09860, partial [Albitalea sp.]|nr:hypothetical protein [Albitalea sp.]